MVERIRQSLLAWWSWLVCRHAGWVLFVTLVVAAGSIAISAVRLEFQADRNALLSKNLDWNQRFEQWRASFPGNEDFYVVVDSGPPDDPDRDGRVIRAKALVDQLGSALQADEHVTFAVWGFDPDRFSPRAMRLLPMDQFEARLQQLAQSQIALSAPTPQRLLVEVMRVTRIEARRGADYDQVAQAIGSLAATVDAIRRVLDATPDGRPSFAQMVDAGDGSANAREYLTSQNGRLYFIRVTPRKEERAINALAAAITAIRAQIDRVSAHHRAVEVGLTGIDVVEADETDAATRDSMVASIIASVLITLLLVSAFRSWKTPLLVMVALLVGVAWSFGFLTVTVGHLQVISVVFAVILLGLGVAFGIHLLSRVELVRRRNPDHIDGFDTAIRQSFQIVGPGVLTGAVTTSAAFCMTLLTEFVGVAEMGLIAAAGILLCLVAMFTVFPALLRLFAPGWRCYAPPERRRLGFFDPAWFLPVTRRPSLTLVVAGLITAASLVAVSRMRFDYDLMNLYPRGVDSVRWQERIAQDGGESIWGAVSVVRTLDEARELKAQYLKLDCVGEVKGIGLLMPHDDDQKLRRIEPVRQQLGGALAAVFSPPSDDNDEQQADPDLVTQLSAVQLAIRAAASQRVPEVIRPRLVGLDRAIHRVIAAYQRLGPQLRQDRLAILQTEYTQWRVTLAQRIKQALDGAPITPEDVPGELLRPYIARGGPHDGAFAMEVHPRLPENSPVSGPLDPQFLPGFISALESVDASVTGVIMQVYRSGYLILHSYRMVGVYAMVVVFVLVWLDFRSLHAAVLSLVPVATGFAATFGVMWLAGVSVNPANIIVLPLMFGIGVDSGVHMIHRYRQDPQTRPRGLTGGAGKGITITSLTSMIGFGSMMFARHRGIASLGFVMMTGIGLTMLACWTVVPAWLELWPIKLGTGAGSAHSDEELQGC